MSPATGLRFAALPALLLATLTVACNGTPNGATASPTPLGLQTAQPMVGATPAPTASPTSTPSVAPSATVAPTPEPTPTPSPTPKPGILLEEFDAAALDPLVWTQFPGTGVLRVLNGKLEAFTSNKQTQFPYLVTKQDVVPKEGPFYFEIAYKVVETGVRAPAFVLDYVPPVDTTDDGATPPLYRTAFSANTLLCTLRVETGDKGLNVAGGAKPGVDHKIRLEYDGVGKYRQIVDGTETGTVDSKRRPNRFYMGPFPMKAATPSDWSRLELDYVRVDVLDAPAEALPAPSPTPKAPAASAAPASPKPATPSPVAS